MKYKRTPGALMFLLILLFAFPRGAVSAGEKNLNDKPDLERLKKWLIGEYSPDYSFENFKFASKEFTLKDEKYLGVDVTVDMTLVTHPSEYPYFKGAKEAIEKEVSSKKMKEKLQKEVEKKIGRLEKENYRVSNETEVEFAIKMYGDRFGADDEDYFLKDENIGITLSKLFVPKDMKAEEEKEYSEGYESIKERIREFKEKEKNRKKKIRGIGTFKIKKAGKKLRLEKIIFLNRFVKKDKNEMDRLGLTVEDYPDGYYRKDSGKFVTMEADPSAEVTIYDVEQEFVKSEDRKHTFKSYEAFRKLFKKAPEKFTERPFVITFKKGNVLKIVEKFSY